MLASGMNLITTVIGFGMSVTFIVFVCTRIICWRMRDAESRQLFDIESGADIEQGERRVGGLEPVLVAAIPTMKFSYDSFYSAEDAQCSICLGEYEEKEVLRMMPKCGHKFHLSCIDVWLKKQSTCPVCRLTIQDSLEPRHLRQATIRMVQALDTADSSGEILPILSRRPGVNSSTQTTPELSSGISEISMEPRVST